jgi:hypothetical protein
MLTGTLVAEDVGKVIVAAVVVLGVIAQLASPEANFVSKMLQF